MHHHRSSTKDTKAGSGKRNQSKGRIETKRDSIKKVNTGALAKQDRLNTLKQLRDAKKEDIMYKKRFGNDFDDRPPPPKVVCIVAFHTQADSLSLKRKLLSVCGKPAEEVAALPPHIPAAVALPNWAQGPGIDRPRILVIDPPRDVFGVLDAAKCADVVLCAVGPHASLEEPSFDAVGYKMLTALKAQGLPVVFGAVHGSDTSMVTSGKKQAEAKKFVTRYFHSELGAETKLFQAGTDEEVKVMLRALAAATPKELTWRGNRGYMMAQEAEYNATEGILSLRGYVRGPGLRCRHLAHLTGHGDFVIEKISTLSDPCPMGTERGGSSSSSVGEKVVDELGPEGVDQQRLQAYDPTLAEQTWPTIEELEAQDKDLSSKPHRKGRGAAQIKAPGEAGGGEEAEAGDGGDDAMGDAEGGNMEDDEGSEDGAPSVAPSGMAGTEDAWDVSSNMTMDVPSSEAVAAEKRRREVLMQRSKEELEFPDEVDTPLEVPARERFQRYRGLKSFRTTPWDPYEDLPVEYSRIFEFEAFASTAKASRDQYAEDCYALENGGVSQLYCCVRLRGVPPNVFDKQTRGVPFVLSGLFESEQKVSVIHGHISRIKDYTEVIKSKQEVLMHAGFRRFSARPTFSDIPRKGSSRDEKFKFMRFLHEEVTTCASFYAPIVFPPCRLLMSVQNEGDSVPELAAAGNVVSVDPKQLLIKRIILTGYPFRTQKNKGVVRFMFFNPNDIRWFKPVELYTKKGLRGHITESLGTHGYMKCRFSAFIKQDDTVCMHLYKRVYPKWHPPAWGGSANAGPEDA
mmetsp:Transcript_85486/g.151224  ORF Transcript_85486/g.151224 Transcript_85486/m.151224 type:complete len:796 (-) Transcript_85486:49-2436(-)